LFTIGNSVFEVKTENGYPLQLSGTLLFVGNSVPDERCWNSYPL